MLAGGVGEGDRHTLTRPSALLRGMLGGWGRKGGAEGGLGILRGITEAVMTVNFEEEEGF